jgi:hypothetical protein
MAPEETSRRARQTLMNAIQHPQGFPCIGSFVFTPFTPGGGPVFVLTMWDTQRRSNYGKRIFAYRLSLGGPGYGPDRVLFEGSDFETHAPPGSSEAIEGLMGFLCLKPGDTDEEYFAAYTPEQLDFCDKWAEALSCEVQALYGEAS